MSYASKYHVPLPSRDGFTYTVEIRRRGWTGSSTELRGALPRPYVVRGGEPGGRLLFKPIALTEAELSVVDEGGGVLQEIQGADPTAYQLVLVKSGTDLFTHYIDTKSYSEPSFVDKKVVKLKGTDGLEMLNNRRLILSGTYISALDILVQALSTVGTQNIVTAFDWWPWLPTELSGTVNPLDKLVTLEGRWEDADVQTRLMDALRSILARFQLRLFQSAGKWYAVQRAYLEDGMLDRFEYDDAGTETASGELDIGVDSDDIPIKVQPFRQLRHQVKTVVQSYSFTPDLDQIVLNGSFEDEGASTSEADEWEHVGGTTREELVNLTEITSNVDPSYNNQWALKITPDSTDSDGARQHDFIFIPANPNYRLLTSFISAFYDDPPGSSLNADLRVRVGDYYLVEGAITFAADVLHGREVDMHIHPFLDPSSNGFAEGTPIIPKGASITLGTPADPTTIELTRDLKVGDSILTGHLSADLSQGDQATIAYWSTGGAGGGLEFYVLSGLATQHYETYMVTPNAESISGFLRVEVVRPVEVSPPSDSYAVLDSVRVTVSAAGSAIDTVARQVSALIDDGFEEELQEATIGDGPAVYSTSRLQADVSGTFYDTMQGSDTGWKVGPYAAAEASTGVFLDELAAREALYQQSSILDRIQATLILRDELTFYPHNVLNYLQNTRLSYVAPSGADYIVTPTRLRVGRAVTIGNETFGVTALSGGGPYRADLDGTFVLTYAAGTVVHYTTPAWFDFFEWDVWAGEFYFDGTEIYRNAVAYETDVLIEGT